MSYFADLREVAADRPIRLVLLASVINTFGTGLFAASYVMFGLRADVPGDAMAAALSFGALVAVVSTPFGAVAAERHGSRNLAVGINLARGLANLLLVVAPPWLFVLVIFALSVMDRFAFPASQSVLAAVATRGDRALVLSVRQLSQTLGLALGTGTAAVFQLAAPREALGALIVVNGLTFVCNGWLFSRLPIETGPPRPHVLPWRQGWPPATFMCLLVLAAVLDCVLMSVEFGLPLYALANETALVPWVGAVIAVESATGVVVTAALGRWMTSERLVSSVLFGAFVCASACALIALAFAQRVGVIAAALVFGVLIGVGTTVVSFAVYLAVVELAPEDERERYMAAYGLSGSLRRIVAPVLLLALVTSASGWGWMGVMCAVVGTAMAWLVKRSYMSTSTEEMAKT